MARCAWFLSLLISLACGLWPYIASAEELSAQSTLREIVEREFNADIMARRGRVIFTDGKGATVGNCDCSMPREAWALDDEYVIASAWDIADTHAISADKATIDVRYHVVGKAVESAYDDANRVPGRLQIISAPHQPYDEVVSYKLVRKKQGWMLVDPPLPRVSVEPVRAVLSETLGEITARIDKAHEQANKKWEKAAQVHSLYVQSQLAVLDYITFP